MSEKKHFLLMALVMLGLAAATVHAETASVLLEKAIHKEEAAGDLDAAIQIYRQIIDDAKANRKHVAEAHFRLGMCLLKKKPAEAEAVFRELVERYSDQKALVASARKQMALSRKRITGAELAAIVDKAVMTISTCAETDPKVKESLATLEGLDEARTVKAIVKSLRSEKNTVRRSAIYILWKGEFSSIAPAETALTKLCEHSESYTRGMAALALGGRKIDAAFKPLCDMTLKDESHFARRCAAYALGLLGDDRAKGILEKALKDKNEMVRNNAEAALTMLAMATAGKAQLPPAVVKTTPAAFASDVPASLDKIAVTFDQPMMDKSWSWTQYGKGETFPRKTGEPSYDQTRTKCTLPVKLEPGKVYWVGINSAYHHYFQTPGKAPATPYVILFATAGADGKATPIPKDRLKEAKEINAAHLGAGARDLALEGWRLWRHRKLAEAEAKFRQAVEKDPANADAWNGLGWAQQNQGKSVSAKASFIKALTIDPKLAAALNGLGWIAKAEGKTNDAIDYWTQAVEAMPTATAAISGLAATYLEVGRPDKAEKYYRMWLEAEPGNKDAAAGVEKTHGTARAVVHMDRFLKACFMYAGEHNDEWPKDLQALIGQGVLEPKDAKDLAGLVYLKPPLQFADASRVVVLYGSFDVWKDGIYVGFLDGRVKFISDKAEFRKLLKASSQASGKGT